LSINTPPLSYPAMNTFPLDSDTRGARFLNLTAAVKGDHLELSGLFQSQDLLPILLFSVGTQWVEPCVKHVCCLWDIAERYKDHDLLTALGPTCNENVDLSTLDLLKGNDGARSAWTVDTMIHPSFVAMLFVTLAPVFYMYYEILPMQWVDGGSAHWQASWYGQPCHQVMYPNNQQVCIACFNSKPENAVFVFSANWFSTFQCDWRCKPGFVGPNCEITVNVAVYVAGCLMATLLLSGMIVCVLGERRRRKQAMDEDHADGAAPSENTIVPAAQRIQPANVVVPPMAVDIGKKRPTTDIIAFKENAEIRIKFL
jgi:hypothetical protein